MRGTTKLLCLIIAGALLAVSAPAEARISLNRLASNRISLNKLSANRLSSNKLAGNRIASNKIAFNKLAGNRLVGNRIALNQRAFNTVHAAPVAPQLSAQRSIGDGAVTTISAIQFADGTQIQN